MPPRAAQADVDDFLHKWRGRWPEWRIAQSFLAADHRLRAEAWFALLQEFTDAAWGGADPTPGIAKLGWWQEELRGWSKGARRHPLGIALQRVPAPWPALAVGLAGLQAARGDVLEGRIDGVDAAAQHLRACADAIAACERVLFADVEPSTRESSQQVPSQAVPSQQALPQPSARDAESASNHEPITTHGAFGLLALQTLWASADAAERDTAARTQARAQRLLQAWTSPAATRPRRVYDALIRRRLRAVARGGGLAPLSPWVALWAAWRAARG
jgi:hypothetical protein